MSGQDRAANVTLPTHWSVDEQNGTTWAHIDGEPSALVPAGLYLHGRTDSDDDESAYVVRMLVERALDAEDPGQVGMREVVQGIADRLNEDTRTSAPPGPGQGADLAALAEVVARAQAELSALDGSRRGIEILTSVRDRLVLLAAPSAPGEAAVTEGGSGVALIAAERQRQVNAEGWTPEHDAQHVAGQLAWAAACYAAPGRLFVARDHAGGRTYADPWPWHSSYDKRRKNGANHPTPATTNTERIRELVKAGALVAAEIDRRLVEAAPFPAPAEPESDTAGGEGARTVRVTTTAHSGALRLTVDPTTRRVLTVDTEDEEAPLAVGDVVATSAELHRRALVGTVVRDADGDVGKRVASEGDVTWEWGEDGGGAVPYPVTVVRVPVSGAAVPKGGDRG